VHDQEAGRLGCPRSTLHVGAFDSSPHGAVADAPKLLRLDARGGVQGGNEASGKFGVTLHVARLGGLVARAASESSRWMLLKIAVPARA